jgi:hypothetical protein
MLCLVIPTYTGLLLMLAMYSFGNPDVAIPENLSVPLGQNGMLANADGVMPHALKFEGDKRFFSAALDRVELIVHGRNSHEHQPNSARSGV